jgi:hypothetical protein
MKKKAILVLLIVLGYLQIKSQIYSESINQKSGTAYKLISILKEFEQKGIKEPGTAALDKTCDWLLSNYQKMGYQPFIDSFQFNGYWLRNVISEKKGRSQKYIIVCGHYDTRNGPGANDNGSGVCTIMEMARILQPLPVKYTVRFIHFSGEEVGLTGSKHYAQNIVGLNDSNLMFVFNLDQLGGTRGTDNSKIYCERDEDDNPTENNAASAALTDSLGRLMSLYSNLTPVIGRAYSSDYIPFENMGYVITGLYQYSQYPPYHSEKDMVIEMDTNALKQVAKGAIASVLYFSIEDITAGIFNKDGIICHAIYPNPGNVEKGVYIDCVLPGSDPLSIELININGCSVFSEIVQTTPFKLPSWLKPGVYFIKINRGQKALTKKLIVSH